MDEETSRDSEVSAEKVESTVEISPALPSVSSVPENWKEIDVKSENDDSKTVTASAEGKITHLLIYVCTYLFTFSLKKSLNQSQRRNLVVTSMV